MDSQNEFLLQVFMKKLTKIYNLTLSEFEYIQSKQEDSNEINNTSLSENDASNETFRQCKEKAFDFLIKAQNLNDTLSKSRQNECLNDRCIDEILDKYQMDRQNQLNDLNSLYKSFEFSSRLSKQTRNQELIGLKELKDYLINSMGRLISSDNSFLNEGKYVDNAKKSSVLVYGPSGSGKLSLIIDFLTRNGFVRMNENQENLKIFFIDFKSLLIKEDKNAKLTLIEDLMKSIDLLINKHNLRALIILNRVEALFDETASINDNVRDRYICDLLYELYADSKSQYSTQLTHRNNRIFIMLSQLPWLLHPSILYK